MEGTRDHGRDLRKILRREHVKNADVAYLDIVDRIMEEGVWKDNRTGIRTLAVAGAIFEHEMGHGFPLLTTKRVPFRLISTELEFFIKGKTDKKWLQDRGNTIWNEWASPQKAPYGHSDEAKKKMLEERDLGPVYGWQWRHFGAEYRGHDADYTGQGEDQLAGVVKRLRTDPNDRRMIVTAWNPQQLHQMALPACHYGFQVTVTDGRLNLLYSIRSVDVMLGLPFNIASYGLLLHLLAEESGFQEGRLVGFLADTHIYENHMEAAKLQLSRDPRHYPQPTVRTDNFSGIFDWKASDSTVEGYQSYPAIKMDIAV